MLTWVTGQSIAVIAVLVSGVVYLLGAAIALRTLQCTPCSDAPKLVAPNA